MALHSYRTDLAAVRLFGCGHFLMTCDDTVHGLLLQTHPDSCGLGAHVCALLGVVWFLLQAGHCRGKEASWKHGL